MALDTYSDLQTAVLGWLARPGDPLVAPAVPDMVRLFEAEASRRLRVGAAEKSAIVTIAAGAPFVNLPDDFAQLRRASIDGATLTAATPASLSGLTGTPVTYAVWGQSKLWLAPVPDTAYYIELLYQSGVPPLTSANPTNWLLAQAPDAYLFGVLLEAELYIGHDERVGVWGQRLEAAFASIEQADRKARWGGPLTIQVDGITMPAGSATVGGGSAMSPPVLIDVSAGTALPDGFQGSVMVDPAGLAVTVLLPPSPSVSQAILIKDATGGAAANPITVDGNGEDIEGATTLVISFNYGWVQLLYSGSQWVQA